MIVDLARLLRRLADVPALPRERIANQRQEAAATAPLTRHGPRSVTTLLILLLTAAVLWGGALTQPELRAQSRIGGQRAPTGTGQRKAAQLTTLRKDVHGDSLPFGAVARFGTIRLRHANAFGLAFSPDGKLLASAGRDGLVRLWDRKTGAEVRRLSWDHTHTYSVAFSPDGKLLATGDITDVYVWEVATGKKVRILRGFINGKGQQNFRGLQSISNLVFSRDGKKLAVAEGGLGVSVWAVDSGKMLIRMGQPVEDVYRHIRFLPDSRGLAAATSTVVRRWRNDGRDLPCAAPKEVDKGGTVLAVAPDARVFVLRFNEPSDKERLSLRDTVTGKEVHSLELSLRCWAGAISPDGKTLAYTQRGDICLLDLVRWKEVGRIKGGQGRLKLLAFSPDGKVLLGAGRASLGLWDVSSGQPLLDLPGHAGKVNALGFSSDGTRLVSVCREDGTGRLWHAKSGRQLLGFRGDWEESGAFFGDSEGVHALVVDGTTVLSSPGPNQITLWNGLTGRRFQQLRVVASTSMEKRGHWPLALGLSPDRQLLTSVSSDNKGDGRVTLLVQEVNTGKSRSRGSRRVRPGSERVGLTVLSPDRRLAAEADERTLRLFDVATGKTLRSLRPAGRGRTKIDYWTIVFSPDGRLVACGTRMPGDLDSVRLWEVATGKEVLALPTGYSSFLALSPDGRTLTSIRRFIEEKDEGQPIIEPIHVWDLASGEQLCTFLVHGTHVSALAYAPDGRRLATGLDDSTILLWDLTFPLARLGLVRRPASTEALAQCWTQLAGDDASKAHRAIRTLAASPRAAVALLRERLSPCAAVSPVRLQKLIGELSSKRFGMRKAATAELQKLDMLAEPALHATLRGKPTLEQRRRVEQLLERLNDPLPAGSVLQGVRSITVLEYIGTAEARRMLERLAGGAPAARLTREARAALERLNKRPADGR